MSFLKFFTKNNYKKCILGLSSIDTHSTDIKSFVFYFLKTKDVWLTSGNVQKSACRAGGGLCKSSRLLGNQEAEQHGQGEAVEGLGASGKQSLKKCLHRK